MTASPRTEVWQRGPVPGFEPLLMPVVHALMEVQENLAELAEEVPDEHVWLRPGGAASIGFHVRHAAGAIDRLFTYARGDTLTDAQRAALREEAVPGEPQPSLRTVASEANGIIDSALQQLRSTPVEMLLHERRVGRAGLPSNVIGLLFHAAEHSTRHVGQAITTAKILRGG